MEATSIEPIGYHALADTRKQRELVMDKQETKLTYTFENFFHPFVGELIEKLNQESLSGMLDPSFHAGLAEKVVSPLPSGTFFTYFPGFYEEGADKDLVTINGFPKEIDVSEDGPYANYNWELLFHIPLTIAVHLSKNQRFAEAQRWFHYIFDPTCNDTSLPPPQRFWKFLAFRSGDVMQKDALYALLSKLHPTPEEQKLRDAIRSGKDRQYRAIRKGGGVIQHDQLMALLSKPDPTPEEAKLRDSKDKEWQIWAFRQGGNVTQIDELLVLLSRDERDRTQGDIALRKSILNGYEAIKDKPFQPHVVARTRQLAYQYCVVMKYLDNLIAWGDHLFRQDTVESINEATQRYVLAANLLGTRPQRIPSRGTSRPKTFAQLKAQRLDPMGNALVELEGKFPFNLRLPHTRRTDSEATGPLFGMGRTLYFCIPQNDKLLGYWDTVADRLFKIRHCMNIEGVVRQLALFDPPLDPGMLVKAAAAGINIGAIVSGLNQPTSPVRAPLLMQKALELCAEVRSLGAALLSAIEKGDGEHMALLRQGHEIKIQQMQQDVRFLQWKQAQEATESLLKSRASALERYRYYQRLLGLTPDSNAAPDTFPLDRRELTKETFDEAYAALVGQYDKTVTAPDYPPIELRQEGRLQLHVGEYDDLNEHADRSLAAKISAAATEAITAVLGLIPTFHLKASFWGVGPDTRVGGGDPLSSSGRAVSSGINILAQIDEKQGQNASKKALYELRADDRFFQNRLAAYELMQIGRQIIGSLIAEQVAHNEYLNIQKQIEHFQEVDRFLHEKFTNEELYAWMQGEISRLYYEYYRFAFDTARKAEQTMKRELMRPEVDATDYVKFNYWDAGRKGLLSGEALYLDIKRMEIAYHEHNKREYELTKHVSLRQLNPLALLALKATGACEVTLPEWLFDLDGPGHYMRRIKSVSLSIPSVTGPYTSVSCTLTLLKSSIRKSPLLMDDEYARKQGSEDSRFVDYFGTIQSIMTSSGNNDSGLFETNLREERFLPFEGAGAAESTWKLDLPAAFRQFDYNTISDVILHVRYTARQGGAQLRDKAVEHLEALVGEANTAGFALLLSLTHDFPSEWHRFVTGNAPFTATVKRDYFPYFTQGKVVHIRKVQLHAIQADGVQSTTPEELNQVPHLETLTGKLNEEGAFELSLPSDGTILVREQQAYVFVLIQYSVESVIS